MNRRSVTLLQFGSHSPLGFGYNSNIPQRKMDLQDDSMVVEGMRRRLDFYDWKDDVHPAKNLAYFITRHLRRIPADWRNYYRGLFRSEFNATRGVNKNWDQFCYVHDGYRKAKWVLKKYGQEPTQNSIPEPYATQWASASPEERAWAYRRSFHLKELQALQRETCEAFGSIARDRSNTIMSHAQSTQPDPSKTQTGNNVHSEDLPTPRERMIRDDVEMSEVYMMTIQDDKQWNPLLRKETVGEAEFWGFEDDDDEDDLSPSATSARKRRNKREESTTNASEKQSARRAAGGVQQTKNPKHSLSDHERSSSSDFNPNSHANIGSSTRGRRLIKVSDEDNSNSAMNDGLDEKRRTDDSLSSSIYQTRKGREGDLSREELLKQTVPIRPTGSRIPSSTKYGN